MQINDLQLILLCARLNINNDIQQKIKELISEPLDWEKIIDLSIQHQILPFLYYNLNKLNFQDIVPQHIFTKMKSYYYMNINRNLMFEREMSLISGSAEHNGINFIPIKGSSLMFTLYDNPGLRIMADVDMLIKKNGLKKIALALHSLGYNENVKKDDDCRHMAIFSKRLSASLYLNIEIHSGLAYARPYEIKIPRLWERAYKKSINNQNLLFLSPEDTFISLALHLRSHTRRLTLKFIVDIAELLNKECDKFDWAYIKKIAQDNHIMTTVYTFVYIAKELLGAKIPNEILNEFQPDIIKRCLIYAAINKYNFFRLKNGKGIFLRLLLFDRTIDLILYMWKVSFLERFLTKISAINSGEKIKNQKANLAVIVIGLKALLYLST